MNKIILASFAFLSSLMIMEGCSTAKTSQNSGNIVRSKTINLFNGKNLDGWYTFLQHNGRDNDPKKVFTVHEGLIHISGEEWGCITTKEEYSNYKLLVEFKWGTQTYAPRMDNARDNGILLHSTGKDGGSGGIWMHSIECQIIEGGTGDFIIVGDGSQKFAITSPVGKEKQGDSYIFQPHGSMVTINEGRINWFGRDPDWKDAKGFRGEKDMEKPVGEWNRLECIAEGDKISIILNGTLVNQAINVSPSKGHIQIQSEGAEIFFRRVDLIPLNQK
ncbi:MAG: DUF1080 domain-containing protein [Ginsengibacter sp.]